VTYLSIDQMTAVLQNTNSQLSTLRTYFTDATCVAHTAQLPSRTPTKRLAQQHHRPSIRGLRRSSATVTKQVLPCMAPCAFFVFELHLKSSSSTIRRKVAQHATELSAEHVINCMSVKNTSTAS
jgi:hypothetical protein